jgi:DNA-binding transcriptional ArsR family regulator
MAQSSKRRSAAAGLRDLLSPRLFKALADANRCAIVDRLCCDGPGMVSDIAGCCDVDLSVVSRHLAQLRDAGVLESERRGKEIHYRLRADRLAAYLRGIADALETAAPDRGEKP